ncbi:hypothetical protein QV08_06520 [Gallibacterium salpingitidis]|uniref:RDD domain-containing protein n=1 Tax=Gallibacterium salpingitidis TaxID=505341 RepID=A0AB36E068_9PAST|nr:RDD family protein [Gallibacterium salpingitidis]OBX07647.1 hypothetical protein QV09_10410 [Gallibacterium salpingitidis]OBX07878.1 hypothetical protein QV08_06520 [Gallibacterium salpingitidis]WKT00809.1 RDD family protein [Gallibacterium salpingitidis]
MALVEPQYVQEDEIQDFPVATIARRIAAVLLNSAYAFICSFIIPVSVGRFGSEMNPYIAIWGISAVVVLLSILPQLYCMYRYRQTIGKRIMKIKVIREPNREISFSRYFLREVIDTLFMQLLSIFYIIPNFLVAVWNGNKHSTNRSLTDLIIGSRVVQLPKNR